MSENPYEPPKAQDPIDPIEPRWPDLAGWLFFSLVLLAVIGVIIAALLGRVE